MYKIQAGRYGTDWQDEVVDLKDVVNPDTLDGWIFYARDLETHERYNYRIVDETGKVYWHQCMPFEPMRVNIADEKADWLDDIRAGYGIDPDIWATACRVYLDNYYKEQNEKLSADDN